MTKSQHPCQKAKSDVPFADDMPCIKHCSLFDNVDGSSLYTMLGCIRAHERHYDRGETILRSGDVTTKMGLILEGGVRVERCDYWGNRTVMATFGTGQSFAEVYASTPNLVVDVDVVATEPTRILSMDVGRVTTMCSNNCIFHTQLIRNLLSSVTRRTYALTRKIDHLSKRSTRAKLLSYLSDCSTKAGSCEFTIPFDRQELADYLAVDRSAMSAELSRMKRDGLLEYHKNHFKLNQNT